MKWKWFVRKHNGTNIMYLVSHVYPLTPTLRFRVTSKKLMEFLFPSIVFRRPLLIKILHICFFPFFVFLGLPLVIGKPSSLFWLGSCCFSWNKRYQQAHILRHHHIISYPSPHRMYFGYATSSIIIEQLKTSLNF